jgi:hypothetical protein
MNGLFGDQSGNQPLFTARRRWWFIHVYAYIAQQQLWIGYVGKGSMLSKKDFWPWSKEQFFNNKPASRILIQVALALDSIVAHICRSEPHRSTFSTASAISGHDCIAATSAHPDATRRPRSQ